MRKEDIVKRLLVGYASLWKKGFIAFDDSLKGHPERYLLLCVVAIALLIGPIGATRFVEMVYCVSVLVFTLFILHPLVGMLVETLSLERKNGESGGKPKAD